MNTIIKSGCFFCWLWQYPHYCSALFIATPLLTMSSSLQLLYWLCSQFSSFWLCSQFSSSTDYAVYAASSPSSTDCAVSSSPLLTMQPILPSLLIVQPFLSPLLTVQPVLSPLLTVQPVLSPLLTMQPVLPTLLSTCSLLSIWSMQPVLQIISLHQVDHVYVKHFY